MRKLLVVLIFLISVSSVFPQSYKVNFFQTNPAYYSSSVSDEGKSIFCTFRNNSDEIYFSGNYITNNFSYITKYSVKGDKIFTYDFHEQIYFTSGFIAENSFGQLILVGQVFSNSTTCLRIICFDSDGHKLWDIITPANPQSTSFYISDLKFDSDNNIYLTGDYRVSGSYVHSFTFKYSSLGSFLWQRNINTSAWPESPQNEIFQIKENSIYTCIRFPSNGGGSSSYFSFYELDKFTGNIIRSKSFAESFSTLNTCQVKVTNNYVYLGCRDYLNSTRAYCLRKINSNWDTIWTKKIIGTQGTFELDKNDNVYITTTPTPFDQGVTVSLDVNGNQRWIKNNLYGKNLLTDSTSVSVYGPNGNLPVVTKFDFNGNNQILSELYNPYLNLSHLFFKNNEYKVIGTPWDQTSPINTQFNTFNRNGLLTNSVGENFLNDYALDMKLFNNILYIAGYSGDNESFSTAFISKYSSNGLLHWGKNIFYNTKGPASINSITPNSTTIYGTGELFDTTTLRTNAVLITLDISGNPGFNFSFKNILNRESSGKTIKINNNSAFVAGQFKDSLNRAKVFISRNTGNENIWIKRLNVTSLSSDSLVSLSIDQSDNCYISYNSFTSGMSKEYTILKFNSSGAVVFSKTFSNVNGIFLKKSETDPFSNSFTLASTKINGNYDLLTQKLDSTGNILWSDSYNNSFNTDDIAADLVLDPANNVIITGNFVNSIQQTSALIMKISYLGERLWNKTYSSANKFIIKKLNTDDLYCNYVSGYATDASGNSNILTLEYDKEGIQRYAFNYNQRDPAALLSFANDYLGIIITNVQGGQKYMYSSSNINRIDLGSDVKINIFNSTITLSESSETGVPKEFKLLQNYPNPFNPNTVISYKLSFAGNISLNVYDANGRLMKILESGYKTAGNYQTNFSAEELSSGIYYYRLSVNGVLTDTKKMILLK